MREFTERDRLLREEYMHSHGYRSIREMPLDKAYPHLCDYEYELEMNKKFKESKIQLIKEKYEVFYSGWRRKYSHIYDELGKKSLCRKSNKNSEGKVIQYSEPITIKVRVIMEGITYFEDGQKYRKRYKVCNQCWEKLREFHERE